MPSGNATHAPGDDRGVVDFAEKTEFLCSRVGMSLDAFVIAFHTFLGAQAKNEKKKQPAASKEQIRIWVSGGGKPQGKNVGRVIAFWATKGVTLTEELLRLKFADFDKHFGDQTALGGDSYNKATVSIALQLSVQPIPGPRQNALAGKYKSYRYSLSNKHEITEEWVIIKPRPESGGAMAITIYCYPVVVGSSDNEHFSGTFFQVGDTYHALVSCPPLGGFGGRVRFLSFPVAHSHDIQTAYGIISGTSVALSEPVAACVLMGKMSESTELAVLERTHIARIDPVEKTRIAAATTITLADGTTTDVPADWYDTPQITDHMLEYMISNDIKLHPIGGNPKKGDSVLTVSRGRNHFAADHFRLLKEWYEKHHTPLGHRDRK